MTTRHETCPLCGSESLEIRHDKTRQIKYLKKPHTLEGLEHTVCLECGCSFNVKGQTERNNARFLEFETKLLNGIISPRQIIELRQKYNLTQEMAKQIFKSTGNLFSKWERGESAPSSAVSNILLAALEDPTIMGRLAQRANVSIAEEKAENTVPAGISSASIYLIRQQSQHQYADCTTFERYFKDVFKADYNDHDIDSFTDAINTEDFLNRMDEMTKAKRASSQVFGR